MKLVYRPMRPEDKMFVVASWLASFRRSMHAGMIAMDDWSAVMVPQIDRVLARPRVRVLVAADPTETDRVADLFGYLVWEERPGQPVPLVYYCYIKHAYRRSGLARGLMKAARIDTTKPFDYVCQTQAVGYLRDAGKLAHARWRPMLGRYSNERQIQEHEDHP